MALRHTPVRDWHRDGSAPAQASISLRPSRNESWRFGDGPERHGVLILWVGVEGLEYSITMLCCRRTASKILATEAVRHCPQTTGRALHRRSQCPRHDFPPKHAAVAEQMWRTAVPGVNSHRLFRIPLRTCSCPRQSSHLRIRPRSARKESMIFTSLIARRACAPRFQNRKSQGAPALRHAHSP